MRPRCLAVALASVACLAGLAGCATPGKEPAPTPTPEPTGSTSTFALVSPSFPPNGTIPERHTCDGAEVSPALATGSHPDGTVSLALTVKDPDAPTPQAPTRTLRHWVVWNLTPVAGSVRIEEGRLPPGAQEGANDFGHGWLGPCPPQASPAHRYNFTVYALDVRPALPENATADQLEAAMEGHVLDRTSLVGFYARRLTSVTTTPAPPPAPDPA